MEQLIKVLEEVRSDVNFREEKHLFSGGMLDSFDMICVVTGINDAFNIKITVNDLNPENFDSVEQMMKLIEKLRS